MLFTLLASDFSRPLIRTSTVTSLLLLVWTLYLLLLRKASCVFFFKFVIFRIDSQIPFRRTALLRASSILNMVSSSLSSYWILSGVLWCFVCIRFRPSFQGTPSSSILVRRVHYGFCPCEWQYHSMQNATLPAKHQKESIFACTSQ